MSVKTIKSPQSSPDNDITQRQKFIDAAHQAGCDENEAAFTDKLRRIAKQQPKEEKPAK